MNCEFMKRNFGKLGGFYTFAVPIYLLLLMLCFNRGGSVNAGMGIVSGLPENSSIITEEMFDYYTVYDADGAEEIYEAGERVVQSMDETADTLMSGGSSYFDDVDCVSLTSSVQSESDILYHYMSLGGELGQAIFGAVKDSGKWEYFFVPADGSEDYLISFKLPSEVANRKGVIKAGAQIDIYSEPGCYDSSATLVVAVRKENGSRQMFSYYVETGVDGKQEFTEAGRVNIKDSQNAYMYSYNELHLVTNGLLGQKVKSYTFDGSTITEADVER